MMEFLGTFIVGGLLAGRHELRPSGQGHTVAIAAAPTAPPRQVYAGRSNGHHDFTAPRW